MDNFLDMFKPRVYPWNPSSPPIVLGGNKPIVPHPSNIGSAREEPRDPYQRLFEPRDMTRAPRDSQPIESAPGGERDIMELYKSVYQPDTTFSDMYKKGLDNMPERNQPGIWRKIAAALIGATSGPDEGKKFLYGSYINQMEDWEARQKAVAPAVSNERGTNAVERQAAADVTRDEIAARRAKTAADSEERRRTTDAENIKVRQRRVLIAEYKSTHPNHRFFEDENGKLVSVNPVDNSAEYVVGPDGPVETGKLGDEEKINLQIEGRIKVAEIQARNAAKLEGQRQSGRIAVKTTPPAGKDDDKEITTETSTAVVDAEGKPAGARTTRVVKSTSKPGSTVKMTKGGKTYNIPKDKIAQAKKDGLVEAK